MTNTLSLPQPLEASSKYGIAPKSLKMAETTRWDAVLALAITFHSERAGVDILDHKAWLLTNERMAEYTAGNNRPIAPLPSRHLTLTTTPRP